MYSIRTFQKDDFKAVLDLLNESKEFDTFSEALLEEKLFEDPDWNPDITFITEEAGKIIGFLQGVVRIIRGEKYGYIKLLGVLPKFQRKHVASTMYMELEKEFIKVGVDKVRIYDVPLNYYMPGVDPRYTSAVCFALKQGFKHHSDAINMHVELDYSDWNTEDRVAELKQEGIEVLRAKEADRQELYDFIADEWALWQNEIDMAYKTYPISIYLAKLNGKIKAFSAYNGNNIGAGWFGPMGTHPDLRGKGVGSVLLYLCLSDMKRVGLKTSTIPWVAPISFYSHYTGAKISRVFWRFEKSLVNEK